MSSKSAKRNQRRKATLARLEASMREFERQLATTENKLNATLELLGLVNLPEPCDKCGARLGCIWLQGKELGPDFVDGAAEQMCEVCAVCRKPTGARRNGSYPQQN